MALIQVCNLKLTETEVAHYKLNKINVTRLLMYKVSKVATPCI